MPPEAVVEHERCQSEHRPFRDVGYRRCVPGEDRWIRTSGVPRFDANGTFLGYRGSARDVTELVSVRQRLREAVEAIPGDLLLFDGADRLIYKSNSPGRLPQTEGLDRIGDSFEATLRRAVASGTVAEAPAAPEGWDAARPQGHRG